MKTIFITLTTAIALTTAIGAEFDRSFARDPVRLVGGIRYDLRPAFEWLSGTFSLREDRRKARASGPYAAIALAGVEARARVLQSREVWASRFFVVLIEPVEPSGLTEAEAYGKPGTPSVAAVVMNVPKDAPKLIAAIPVGRISRNGAVAVLYDYGEPIK